MSGKQATHGVESVDALRRRVEELERWFQRQDRQIRYLERERQKLSALVNHTDAGVLVFDTNLSVSWLNNVCRTWFGERDCVQSGRPATCNELLCGAKTICAQCPGAAALASGTVSHREIRLDLKEVTRHIYATAMPIKTPDNRVDECIMMLQDITDLEVLRRSQEALFEAKEVAESATRAKSEFLANMSHEVRTPMTGILSMSTHLLDTPLSTEQRECLSIIQTCGESLLTIINDILDFSRIEAGRLSIEPIPFDIVPLVDEVVTLVAAKAEERGLELLVRYAPDLPCRVIGDAGRIRQVLTNLVGNAVKFTHEGHVLVNVEKSADDAAKVRLRFAVEDTGIGIPADMLTSVFEKFTQADGSITRRYGGTGLGLAISKQLVELMNGEMSVVSAEGVGSTFTFTLPLPVDAEAARAAKNFEGLRTLLVHGHEKLRAVVAEQLAAWNASCHGVATGGEAIAALRAARASGQPFKLAIIDHEMADMSAEALARAIRNSPARKSITLALLASVRPPAADWLQTAGFDTMLTRPTCPSQLADVLSMAQNRVIAPATSPRVRR